MPKITILADNNTIIDKYLLGEPALSLYIEADNKKILFDTGYSDVFLKNAHCLNLKLEDLDYIVLSHGHNDHTGGLVHLLEMFSNAEHKPPIIAGSDVFIQRYDNVDGDFGSPVSKEKVEKVFDIRYSNEPVFLTENIVFLGKIPRTNNFEAKTPVGLKRISDEHDYVEEDSALAIKTEDGIVIVTGCSHSGIVNICEYAKKVCKTDKIVSIIGGLHLKEAPEEQIEKTVDYIKNLKMNSLYACHCTGFQAQCKLNPVTNLKEVGSGLKIKL